MPQIRLAYTLTQDDLTEFRAHAKYPNDPRSGFVTVLSLLVLLLLIYFVPILLDFVIPPGRPEPRPLGIQFLLFFMPAILAFAWIKIILPINARLATAILWKNSLSLHQLQSGELTDEGVHSTSDFGSSFYRWVGIQALIETPNLLLLATSAANYIILPKRAFPAGTDLPQLLQQISSRINSMKLSAEVFAAQVSTPGEPLLLPLLHFTLAPVDLSKARRMMKTRHWGQKAIFIALWIAFFLVVQYCFFVFTGGNIASAVLPLLIALLMGTIVLATVESRWHWRKMPELHGPQTLEVTDSGLRFVSPSRSVKIGWGAITRFTRGQQLFVLSCRDNSLRLVPESAFLNKETMRQFDLLLREHTMATPGFSVLRADTLLPATDHSSDCFPP